MYLTSIADVAFRLLGIREPHGKRWNVRQLFLLVEQRAGGPLTQRERLDLLAYARSQGARLEKGEVNVYLWPPYRPPPSTAEQLHLPHTERRP